MDLFRPQGLSRFQMTTLTNLYFMVQTSQYMFHQPYHRNPSVSEHHKVIYYISPVSTRDVIGQFIRLAKFESCSFPACPINLREIIAFDKERVHNAVEIDIFGLCIHRHQFGPPEKLFRGE